MKLSLARWDYQGSSRGFWMVRELPSTLIMSASGDRGWLVKCGLDLFDGFEDDAARVWGSDYEARTRHLPDRSIQERYFPTRFSALAALEASLSPDQPSLLPGAIS